MNTLNELLGIIATERRDDWPPIDYRLELVQKPDGRLEWEE